MSRDYDHDMAIRNIIFTISFIITTCFVAVSQADHYLIVGGDGGGSHYYIATAIGRELAHRGHKVTVLVSDMYADEAFKRDGDRFTYQAYKSKVTAEQFQTAISEISRVGMTGDYSSILRVTALTEQKVNVQCESILMDTSGLNRLRQQKIDLIIGDLFYIMRRSEGGVLGRSFYHSLSPFHHVNPVTDQRQSYKSSLYT